MNLKRQDDPIRDILDRLASESYVGDPAIATSIYMAQALERPLLIEGRAGVGKTEIANVMARLLDTRLIRLQWLRRAGCLHRAVRVELPAADASH